MFALYLQFMQAWTFDTGPLPPTTVPGLVGVSKRVAGAKVHELSSLRAPPGM